MSLPNAALLVLNGLSQILHQQFGFSRACERISDPIAFETTRTRATSALMYGLLGIAVNRKVMSGSLAASSDEITDALDWDFNVLGTRTLLFEDVQNILPEASTIITEILKSAAQLYTFELASIGDIYEQVISADFRLEKGNIHWIVAHEGRNRQGAFFTPDDLATQCSSMALDRLILQRTGIKSAQQRIHELSAPERAEVLNVIYSAFVSDYSCGTGRFLRAYLRLASTLVQKVTRQQHALEKQREKSIVAQLIGIDVDYIALEIAKITLVGEVGDFSLYEDVSKKFRFGNPLIHRPMSSETSAAKAAFQAGLLYSHDLGINLYQDIYPSDLILGNPPWERVRLEERSFFFSLAPEITSSTNKDKRSRLIENLRTDAPALYLHYQAACCAYNQAKSAISENPYFSNSAHGELNTYALFTELTLNKRLPNGVVGLLVKTGLVATASNKRLFRHIVDHRFLVSIADFTNSKKIFPIDSRERFCFLVLGDNDSSQFLYGGLFSHPSDLGSQGNYWEFPFSALELLNAETGMLPNLGNPDDLKFLLKVYKKNHLFSEVYARAKFGRLVHFTNHASDIRPFGGKESLPVYEGKFIEQYDGRYATFEGIPDAERHTAKASARILSEKEKSNKEIYPVARYFVSTVRWQALSRKYDSAYSLIWRSLTSATNRRTCIATILPHQPTSQSIQFLQLQDNRQLALILAIFNSTIFDYILRLKLVGIDLTQTIIKQMPVPPPLAFAQRCIFQETEGTIQEHLLARICVMLGNDRRMEEFCKSIAPRFPLRNKQPQEAKAEIDALIAKAYGLTDQEYHNVTDSFSQAERKTLENQDYLFRLLISEEPCPPKDYATTPSAIPML